MNHPPPPHLPTTQVQPEAVFYAKDKQSPIKSLSLIVLCNLVVLSGLGTEALDSKLWVEFRSLIGNSQI